MSGVRRGSHTVEDHSSSFNIVGKFAQGGNGLGIIQSESVLPRSISTLCCVDAGPASANHAFLPLTRKRTVGMTFLAYKIPISCLTPTPKIGEAVSE
jgi:hypothetical protein